MDKSIAQSDVYQQFLQQNKAFLVKGFEKLNLQCNILQPSLPSLETAGEILRQGDLVAFPTETVYGLGADALNEKAVLKIFETKRRPLTDPLIVHVNSAQQAQPLINITSQERELFEYLTDRLWPGPLTVLLKANFKVLSRVITANTDFVGIRAPKHSVARDLIKAANRPIAAPSANLFSHVSPTSSVHVFNDFYDQNVNIIDGSTTEFGIQSSVVKIIYSEDTKQYSLDILRFGSISQARLRAVLDENEKFKHTQIFNQKQKVVSEAISTQAPGQLLQHYSPYLQTFVFSIDEVIQEGQNALKFKNLEINLKTLVIIDFMGKSKELKDDILCYLTLTDSGDVLEAMNKLYELLRFAENVAGAENILVYNIDEVYQEEFEKKKSSELIKNQEFLDTVYDKIYRSASGKQIFFDRIKRNFYYKDQ